MNESVVIRSARTHADYLALQDAQRGAWGLTDESYVVPVATLVGANLHGGLVLGAFTPDNKAVGASFAFRGSVQGRPCLYSQLTGIVPEYQATGLGTRLKLAQRDFALREGLPCIAWTFDPLQAGNARFNLSKLGAVGVDYYEDMYGSRTDALNTKGPTDRLLVVWEVSPPPRTIARDDSIVEHPNLIGMSDGEPLFLGLPDDAPKLVLPIPTAIGLLRSDRPMEAASWRRVVREAFQAAFRGGYRATGYFGSAPPALGGLYVMER